MEAKLLDVEPSEELRKLGRSGVDLIATERLRQIEKEGYTRDDDAQLRSGDLALAAVCYASPVQLFSMEESANGVEFCDQASASRVGQPALAILWPATETDKPYVA